MKLLEYKGKELLKKVGIKVPQSIVVDNKTYVNLSFHKEKYREFFLDNKKVIIKAQIIAGKRKQNGFIAGSENYEESLKLIDDLYKKTHNNKAVDTLLVEKKLDVADEYFLSIRYDTRTRRPTISLSKEGGIDVEEILRNKKPIVYPVSLIHGLDLHEARDIAKSAGFEKESVLQMANFIKKAFSCFETFDCKSLEINPIIKTAEGMLFAGDAKIEIDSNAAARQEIFNDLIDSEDHSLMTERELEARKIDLHDHRGVAGKTFVDFDGDIAVLASGGGASLVCMDALIEAGGKPANYTEYSGNPPREKVKRLTEITLSKPNLSGCLVIGGTANFTDVFETLSGFVEGIQTLSTKPNYPIVIRRAGPNDKNAFEMIREFAQKEGLDITTYDDSIPMTKAVKIMVEKANQFRSKNGNHN